MSAHIWYDSPEFRNNFRNLLRDWVKERRNSPSLVLWGLQNESKLPEDFSRECTEIIRELDPTASLQRLVTTCNGGSGTDWDIPQNWTGTYGGNPATYSEDLKKQVLVGEYGAWRTLDLHSEDHSYKSDVYSEERITDILEMKLRLGELSKDSTAGHFLWLLTSHDNPGRVQGGEGYRELDRIGPVNYKGLLTPWEQPLDVYYMYRSNYAPKEKEPMVYIASHTWPDRWTAPVIKTNIVVYSNCDEVELFNDLGSHSLGKRTRGGMGTHFQWDDVAVNYNVLYAVGYVKGKKVAKDYVVLNHLPQAPHFSDFYKDAKLITKPQAGYNYLYRVNCGGGDYTDENGNKWSADRAIERGELVNADPVKTAGSKSLGVFGSLSWTNDFAGMPPYFASQQRTFDPINGTRDWGLFQSFRFGREKLKYYFPVQDGKYLIELYFTEPWLGTGGGMNCKGWRLFDVAINDKTVLKNVDVLNEVGHDGALKKVVKAKVTGGQIVISFPHVASGQAVISAIAIATLDKEARPAASAETILKVDGESKSIQLKDWLDLGDQQFINERTSFSSLPPDLFGAEWLKILRPSGSFEFPSISVTQDADVFIAVDSSQKQAVWLKGFTNTKTIVMNDGGEEYHVFKKRYIKGEVVKPAPDQVCLVMAQPATNMEPAYDLKPVATYKAVDASLRGPSITKREVDGKEKIIFQQPSGDNTLDWTFSVGVGDTYSLTISYNNSGTKAEKGMLQLLSADGILLKQEDILFTPTRQGKLNYISTTTGTMINAGSYTVRVKSQEAEGLAINSLEVQ
jgi:beta-galactosidase